MAWRTAAPVTGAGLRRQAASVLAGAAGRLANAPVRERTGAELSVHLHAITVIVQQWHDGLITTAEKRRLIADENAFFYGREHSSRAIGVSLTTVGGDVAAMISQTAMTGVPAAVHAQTAKDAVDDDEDEEVPWWQR